MLAITVNDLRMWWREPRAVIMSSLLPLLILAIAWLAGTVGGAFTIAVVDDQPDTVRTAIARSPYVRAVPIDRAGAARALAAGEVAGVLDTRDGTLVLTVTEAGDFDVRRNLLMRQQGILADLNSTLLAEQGRPHMAVKETGLVPGEVSDRVFLAAGALAFGALFGGMANASYATAREWERRTVRELLVTPGPRSRLPAAKVVTGTVQSLVANGVAVLAVVAGFGIRPAGHPWLLATTLLLISLGSAAVGVLLGATVRRLVPAVLASVVLSLAGWFVGGGFGPAALIPEPLQTAARVLPSSYAISAVQQLVVVGNGGTVATDLTLLAAATVVTVIAAVALTVTLDRRTP